MNKLLFSLTVLLAITSNFVFADEPAADIIANQLKAAEALRATEASEAAQKIHWNYCMDGPGLWGELDDAWSKCASGLTQSPINIVESEVQANAVLKPIVLDYSQTSAHLENDGHHLGATFDGGSLLSIDGKQYELLSMSLHTPSEHKINGVAAAAEFQFLHQSSSKDTVVLSVLADLGDANPELEKFVKSFPDHKSLIDDSQISYSPSHLFPVSKQYYSYQGSLSTPPCRENVEVKVLKSKITISQEQLNEITTKIPFSSRPTQPLHGRSIQGTTYAENAAGVALSPTESETPVSSTQWTYCLTGPDSWSTLSPMFRLCKDGEHQSPVNIVRGNVAATAVDEPIKFHYLTSDLIVQNAANTIQINSDGRSYVEVGGVKYTLLQGHFYTPSEHLIDGVPAPMEIHLVHKSDDHKLLIIAVLLSEGESNPSLAAFWSDLPRSKVTVDLKQQFDFAELLPASAPTGYFRYSGSLSAPPCDENVEYFVLQESITVSADQIKAFQAIIPHNARPVNNLYGRKITMPESGFVSSGKDVASKPKSLAEVARSAATVDADPTKISK